MVNEFPALWSVRAVSLVAKPVLHVLDVTWRLVLLYCVLKAFVEYIVGEWETIWGAPVTFVVAILTVGVLWHFVLKAFNNRKFEILSARLNLRDEQNARLREKVGTDSPDQIKANIDLLKAELEPLRPRRLAEDLGPLVAALTGTPGSVMIWHDMSVDDARGLAHDFVNVFSLANWVVESDELVGGQPYPPHGLSVRVKNLASLTTCEESVVKAMRSANLDFDVQVIGQWFKTPSPDVEILVSKKPI